MRPMLIILTCIFFVNLSANEKLSANEYRQEILNLFKEYLLMREDGVSMEIENDQIETYSQVLPNKIRKSNPPGMYFARPPGSDWLKRLKKLRSADVEGGLASQCFTLPSWMLETAMCGADLHSLYAATAADRIDDQELFIAKFWLSQICHHSPQLCEIEQLSN